MTFKEMNYKKLLGAGMASLGFVLFSFLVWPIFLGLNDLRAAIESKQTISSDRNAIIEKILALKKTVNSKKAEIGQLATILPSDKKIQEVTVNIEEAARQSGINLRELKTSKIMSREGEKYKILQVELSGSGFYKSIVELLKALEKNLRLFDVQKFAISLDSAGEATGLLNIDLRLFTYYLTDPSNK